MSAIAEPLIEHLRQLERKGQTHVHLDDKARLILREFYKRAKGISSAPPAPAKEAQAVPSAPAQKVEKIDFNTEVEKPAAQPAVAEKLSGSLDGLKQQLAADTALKALGTLREKLVFSEGQASSEVMLVGEAPSYHDEMKGAPFSGPAGKKMEAILKAMGIVREDVYMTNLVKFRPAMANQTTNTRKPSADEINASMRYLIAEIELVKPKIVIVLGATAAKSLIGADVPVKDMLGQFHKVAGVPVRATYHPSYLLHREVTDEKRAVWQDMLAVMDLLDMPISDKQRGFFKKK